MVKKVDCEGCGKCAKCKREMKKFTKDLDKFVGLLQTDRGAAEKFMATHDK